MRGGGVLAGDHAMSRQPLLRARHVRWKVRQALEDTRDSRVLGEATQAELAELRDLLAQSRDRASGLEAALTRIEAALQAGRLIQHEVQAVVSDTQRELQRQGRVLELLYEEETENFRTLSRLRRSADYEQAFSDPQPLVSVIIPTYLQHEMLVARAIPSVLSQTYENIEIVVVGDSAPPETERAIAQLGDPRVRYENLTVRAPYPEDPTEFWRVAGTPPWNAAWELARGAWIAPLNDDDSFRPEHIELLLTTARRMRCEVAYGAIEHLHPDGSTQVVNSWPPESHQFGWQAALVHAGLGFMPMQLGSGALGAPGDWSLCRRMRRAGVRFTKVDEVVVDYYPSLLWREEPHAGEDS
jgi:hypothetical protein